MPNYLRGKKGKLQRNPSFANHENMAHALCRISKSHPEWQKHFVGTAQKWLDGKSTPPTKITKKSLRAITTRHPYQLAGDVLLDLHHTKGELRGGGIVEALHTIGSSVANITGVSKLKEILFGKADNKELSNEQKYFAKALDSTYKDIEERPLKVGPLNRLPQFDNKRYSVWQEPNGQLLVTIHGTKMNVGDLWDDAKILSGSSTISDDSVKHLFQSLDKLNLTYDVAGHSLSTEFIVNGLEKDEHVDKIMLFNPASSPFQNTDDLKEKANNDKYTYFINPSDVVSHGLYQQMSNETIKNNSYIGDYRWNPLNAHSLEQWYGDIDDIDDAESGEKKTKSEDDAGERG